MEPRTGGPQRSAIGFIQVATKKFAVYVTNIVKLFLEHILEPAKEAQLNRRRCVGEFGLDGAAHYTQFYHISESKHFLEI